MAQLGFRVELCQKPISKFLTLSPKPEALDPEHQNLNLKSKLHTGWPREVTLYL